MSLRIIFMGTPEFSVPALDALIAAGHEIACVYAQPPRPAGRGMALRKSPVQLRAEALGIEVRTPHSLRRHDAQSGFAELKADLAIVVAYGLILPQAVLDERRLGCWNIHASLLPRWRGAAPIQRAILAGDAMTGVSIMRMEAGLDTGPVALVTQTMIGQDETAGQLHDRLSLAGAELMVRAAALLEAGTLETNPQTRDGIAYAAKIEKTEARIDWTKSAREVHNQIRGLSPFPGAWCQMQLAAKPERVKLLQAVLAPGKGRPGEIIGDDLSIACGEGAVRVVQLQRAGKQASTCQEFLRGNRLANGGIVT